MTAGSGARSIGRLALAVAAVALLPACSEPRTPEGALPASEEAAPPPPERAPTFRNVGTATAYAGDEACVACHAEEASAYAPNAMARSFHRWTSEERTEAPLAEPVRHAATGLSYSVVEDGGELYQEESVVGPGGRPLHELRRRIDYVMGSGNVARTYFTEENGRLFELPLTWYAGRGWDFSPGYELNNARFGRLMPDRCIACHGSYPEPMPFVEGKYAELPPGIGCERCHGPGALHVAERSAGLPSDATYDDAIVNPRRLPIERRLDVCQQCHVHTPVTVLREGEDAFSYEPSRPLADHVAFFKIAGSIDIVSHADRLRQSACFVATRATEEPLECATCHDPHSELTPRNVPCRRCHESRALERRLASSASLPDHGPQGDCVTCHMPEAQERGIPHGSFTDHWIRVVTPEEAREPPRPTPGGRPLEPYFERDRTGSDAPIYQGAGEIVYASLSGDADRLREAATVLDRALGADTTFGEARFLLGVAYKQLGHNAEAIDALERAVRIDPDRPERLHALAQVYQVAGRGPEAIDSLYRRALELQPALAWIRADYADFLRAQGRASEAEESYRAALAEQPSLAVTWFDLATLLTAGDRLDEAAEAFREAVHLDPSLAEALAPLYEVRTAEEVVIGIAPLGSPLDTLPLHDRGSRAVRITIAGGGRQLAFVNIPAGASARILTPGGALVRALGTSDGSPMTWDLAAASGSPVRGGLYHVDLRGQGSPDRPGPTLVLRLGIVRRERQ